MHHLPFPWPPRPGIAERLRPRSVRETHHLRQEPSRQTARAGSTVEPVIPDTAARRPGDGLPACGGRPGRAYRTEHPPHALPGRSDRSGHRTGQPPHPSTERVRPARGTRRDAPPGPITGPEQMTAIGAGRIAHRDRRLDPRPVATDRAASRLAASQGRRRDEPSHGHDSLCLHRSPPGTARMRRFPFLSCSSWPPFCWTVHVRPTPSPAPARRPATAAATGSCRGSRRSP